MTQVPAITGAYVGLLAASSAIVSKYSKRREPTFGGGPARFQAPSLQDLARLLDYRLDGQPASAASEQRLARVTALATCQALEVPRGANPFWLRPGGYAEQLPSDRERRTLLERHRQTSELLSSVQPKQTRKSQPEPAEQPESMCRYCALFQELLHDFEHVKIEVLNHGARIRSDFDPVTNISAAAIDDFQLFLPEGLAKRALERSHPLAWKQTANELFDVVAGAERPLGQDWQQRRATNFAGWSESASLSREYLYEEAKFPLNEEVYTRVFNVLAIDDFGDLFMPASELVGSVKQALAGGVRQRTVTAQLRQALTRRRKDPSRQRRPVAPAFGQPLEREAARVLSYRYSLEACLRSSYGVGWEENSGLDIDDGAFSASALHHAQIDASLVAHLTREDLKHLSHALRLHYSNDRDALAAADTVLDFASRLRDNGSTEDLALKHQAVRHAGEALRTLWGEEPWLVTISASKRLRYTVPRQGVVGLWQLLTWVTPAFLFTFINRSVCQLPHALLKEAPEAKAPPDPSSHGDSAP